MSSPVLAEKAVVIDGVDKVFNVGSDSEVAALSDINLTVEAGEFISLIGPSGCGKSTLLRLIGDLLAPTTGVLTVFGKSAHEARLDQDYGMVFQHSGLFDWRRVLANIELPLELHGWSKADRSARSAEMDEMTREHMQLELLRIWRETQTTVVFVTHSIPESAFLSNRVVVLSPRPGRIHSVVDVDLGERSDSTRQDPAFFAKATEIREALRAVEGGG